MKSSRIFNLRVIVHAGLTIVVMMVSCAPEQWIIQHGSKGQFSQKYKFIGVSVDRSVVRIHGWKSDSVAMTVNVRKDIRPSYAFLVDSVEDSLLLLGRFNGPGDLAGQHPEIVLEAPSTADLTVQASGDIHVDGMNGPLHIIGSDTVTIASDPHAPLFVYSSGGRVSMELPHGMNADVDFESGPAGEVHFETETFHGSRLRGSVKGTIGNGGVKIIVKGSKGVEVGVK